MKTSSIKGRLKRIPPKTIYSIVVIIACVTAYCLARSCQKASDTPPQATSDFQIENGTLVRYNGTDSVVVLPNEVEFIGVDAFAGCSHVTEVTLPVRLTAIQPAAFADCSQVTFQVVSSHPAFYIDNGNLMRRSDKYLILAARDGALPAESGGVANGAYAHLAPEVEIVLPPSVTTVTSALFQGCRASSIVIPDTVTSIQVGALSGVPVRQLTIPFLGTEPDSANAHFRDIFGNGTISVTHVVLTGGRVGAGAFRGCTSLVQIVLGDGVTGSIGSNAIYQVSSIEHVYIGMGITGLEVNALWSGRMFAGYTLHYAGTLSEWEALDRPSGLLQSWKGSDPVRIYVDSPAP